MILALDTATPAGSVALFADGRELALRTFHAGREHSRRLFPEIEQALADAGRQRHEIEAVAVTIGPGSFTGLRIGLSAAKGLCCALDRPLLAVSTLEVLAARVPFCRLPVCATLDARRGEVYAAGYDTAGGTPRPLTPQAALAPERLLAQWGETDVLYTGDGVDRLRELPAARSANWAPAPLRRPCAATLAWLAEAQLAAGEIADVARAEPEYLRVPVFATVDEQAAGRGTVGT